MLQRLFGILVFLLIAFSIPAGAEAHNRRVFAVWDAGAPQAAVVGYQWGRRAERLVDGLTAAAIHAPRGIIGTAEHYLHRHNPTGFRGPWCAAFKNMVLSQAGYWHTASRRAFDALRDGIRVRIPRPGDEVVFRFSHVGFFLGYGGRGIEVLGGNQHHEVSISTYAARTVLAYVRPVVASPWMAYYEDPSSPDHAGSHHHHSSHGHSHGLHSGGGHFHHHWRHHHWRHNRR